MGLLDTYGVTPLRMLDILLSDDDEALHEIMQEVVASVGNLDISNLIAIGDRILHLIEEETGRRLVVERKVLIQSVLDAAFSKQHGDLDSYLGETVDEEDLLNWGW